VTFPALVNGKGGNGKGESHHWRVEEKKEKVFSLREGGWEIKGGKRKKTTHTLYQKRKRKRAACPPYSIAE